MFLVTKPPSFWAMVPAPFFAAEAAAWDALPAAWAAPVLPGGRRRTVFAAASSATGGRWDCWTQAGIFHDGLPTVELVLAFKPLPALPVSHPARVSVSGPHAPDGNADCHSPQPSQSAVLPGGRPERRSYRPPPCSLRRGGWTVFPAPAGTMGCHVPCREGFTGTAAFAASSRSAALSDLRMAFSVPAPPGLSRKTANGRKGGPWPPHPPERCLAAFAAPFLSAGVPGVHHLVRRPVQCPRRFIRRRIILLRGTV